MPAERPATIYFFLDERVALDIFARYSGMGTVCVSLLSVFPFKVVKKLMVTILLSVTGRSAPRIWHPQGLASTASPQAQATTPGSHLTCIKIVFLIYRLLAR